MKHTQILNKIGLILLPILLIGTFIYSIASVVLAFKNPDMTNIRLLLEHPYMIYIGLGFVVLFIVDYILIKLK